MNRLYFKKVLATIFTIMFAALLVIYPQTAVSSAYKGLRLWSDIVFPSLMPFFVCSEILNKLNFPKNISRYLEPFMRPLFNVPGSGAYPFVMGITSGYPVGAKIVSDMRADNLLSREEAERLLSFCNNSGPLFIIGAVSTGMLNRPDLGIILVLINITSAVSVGIILSLCSKKSKNYFKTKSVLYSDGNCINKPLPAIKRQQKHTFNLSSAFGEAISESAELQLKICGFIVAFSVIINLLLKTGLLRFMCLPIISLIALFTDNFDLVESLTVYICSGLFEITTGISLISNLNIISLHSKICAVMLLIGWAGISVHSQVASIVKKTDMGLKVYWIGKALQSIISAIYAFVYFKIINAKAVHLIEDAFRNFNNIIANSSAGVQSNMKIFAASSLLLFLSLSILLLPSFLMFIYKYIINNKKYHLF